MGLGPATLVFHGKRSLALWALVELHHVSNAGDAQAVKVESAQPADAGAPRRFADYRVHIDTAAVPSGVTLRELI